MKILKNNNTHEVTCDSCKSLLAIEIFDITYTEMVHHGSPFTCVCAACSDTINLYKLPQDWQKKLISMYSDDPY